MKENERKKKKSQLPLERRSLKTANLAGASDEEAWLVSHQRTVWNPWFQRRSFFPAFLSYYLPIPMVPTSMKACRKLHNILLLVRRKVSNPTTEPSEL